MAYSPRTVPATVEDTKKIWQVIFASAMGTMIEWYDFYIFGSLAAVISTKFFPSADPTAAFLSTLATFGAGFAARPFGALFFGRIGDMFAMNRFGVTPDIITCAKGMTSGYAPMGAMIVSDRLFEPFKNGTNTFLHGYTWGGHPVGAAAALANLDIFEREGILQHVRDNEPNFRSTLEKLTDLPIVGDVRGAGYFYGIELVKDKVTRETFDDDESERLLRGFLSKALFDAGLYCRADDRGDPVVQLAPPLIIGQPEFDEIEQILRSVLTEAWSIL